MEQFRKFFHSYHARWSFQRLNEDEDAQDGLSSPPRLIRPRLLPRFSPEESRPVRAAAAAGAAATAADSAAEATEGPIAASKIGLVKKKGRPRKPAMSVVREHNERIAGSISGLDALHEETLKGIAGEILSPQVGCRGRCPRSSRS